MAKIAFICLAHKEPDQIIQKAKALTSRGDFFCLHFDKSAGSGEYHDIQTALKDNPNVAFPPDRVRCGWGEWSIVRATLNAVSHAYQTFPEATHFYLISGDCMPSKSAVYVHQYLDENDHDMIECRDFFQSNWIKKGMKEDRLRYRHIVNERKWKRLFYLSLELQRKCKLERQIPPGIDVQIGSQWWCLRRKTIEAILRFCRERKDVLRFFSTVWIPDETFFQTLVRHLVPSNETVLKPPTFLAFSDYGMPVTFYNDHYEFLLSQEQFFARKISAEASDLITRLHDVWASERTDFALTSSGSSVVAYMTGKGRVGQRFRPRFWEQETTLGGDRQLFVISCKKWHVAKRLLAHIREKTDLIGLEYLFNEEDTALPVLGGIENTLKKRTRHRLAFLRMLYEHYQTDKLAICVDPTDIALVADFFSDRKRVRLLNIDCTFSDEYLFGHIRRIGLATQNSPIEEMERVLLTVRNNIAVENEWLRNSDFEPFFSVSQTVDVKRNAAELARFLMVKQDLALALARTENLFAD